MATAAVTNTFVDATTIEAGDFNANFSDLVTFLNGSVLHLDGSKTMSGNLVMGSNRITGLAAPTADSDGARRLDGDVGVITFTHTGELVVGTGAFRFYLPYNITITEVEAAVGVAATGAAVLVDVNVDGTTIFTTQSNRPSITASAFVASSTTIEDASHTDGQYITVDIDQIGSTLPGENLVVNIRYRRT